VQIEDGKVAKVMADRDGPIHQGYTCYRGRALADVMSNPKRQLHSTKLQPNGSRVRIGAEQAMDEITAKLREIIARHGPESVGMYAGTGMIKSVATVCNEVYVELRKMARHLDGSQVTLRVNPEVGKALKENGGKWLLEMEEICKKTVIVKSDALQHQEQFEIL